MKSFLNEPSGEGDMDDMKSIKGICEHIKKPISLRDLLFDKTTWREYWPMLVPLELGMMNYGAAAVWYLTKDQTVDEIMARNTDVAFGLAMSIPLAGFMIVGALNRAGALTLKRKFVTKHLNHDHPAFEHNEAAVYYSGKPALKDYVAGAVDGMITAAVMIAPGALIYGAAKAYESLEGKVF